MNEDISIQKKRMVKGDFRPYLRTAAPVGDNPEAPQRDWSDDRYACWFGKRIYLGSDSRVARLFWLLSEHLGRPRMIDDVQRAVEGMGSDPSVVSEEEAKKGDQRLRQTVSRLRERLRTAQVDDHIFIHREKTNGGPALTMFRRHERQGHDLRLSAG
jgi:hypothetical protein